MMQSQRRGFGDERMQGFAKLQVSSDMSSDGLGAPGTEHQQARS
jgi:hypothetical protein